MYDFSGYVSLLDDVELNGGLHDMLCFLTD